MFAKKPKAYQQVSIARCVKDRKHFVLYEMGLGKTVVGVCALHQIVPDVVLILCPKNAVRTWEDHIKEWFPGLDEQSGESTPFSIHRWRKKYAQRDARQALWKQRTAHAMNVYIMTNAAFLQDLDTFKWVPDVIIIDEAKSIRNRKSKAFLALKSFAKQCSFFWPMTGTPGRTPGDFWTMFHLKNQTYYGSYWKFVNIFCHVMRNEFGANEVLGLKNADLWYRTLSQSASIVTKAMVKHETNQGDKYRQPLYVEMDDVQERLYAQLKTDMMMVTDDDIIFARTSLDQTLKFRQLLVCPKLLDPKIQSYGSALEDLITTIEDNPQHVVIFTPFVEAFPFISERLKAAGHQNVGFLSGRITPDEQFDRISKYRESRGIIICSIRYAQSFSLEPATRCFFLGYEFDPEENRQAEDRIQRMTTQYDVNAYYYAYENTYDERAMEILEIKQLQTNVTLDPTRVGLAF